MCSVFCIQQKKDLPFQWKSQPKLHGARTGSAREVHVLLDPGSCPSCHSFRSSASSLFVSRFPLCLSGRGYAPTVQSDIAHTPSFLGKQIEAQLAPRIRLRCSCIISWRSGSSELSGQMQLLVNCTKTCAFTRKVCCRWPGGLCFLDCLKNSFLL